jgi:septal ring factor EnvC (AmiA/AmiB activator)
MIRVVIALLAAAALAGLWWHGYKKGEAHDKTRSDLVIANMVAEAKDRLDKANALIRQQSDQMQANRERAERDLQAERQKQARRLADDIATDRLVREQIADVARGPGADQDSLAACRSDASALGDVSERALQAHRVCVEAAESEAAGARALLDAWPKVNAPTLHEGTPSAALQAPQ